MNEGSCLNCGSPVSGNYCPECGQKTGGVPTLRAWLAEVMDELLLVESRLPRTLARLFWPPGSITLEWWEGRRASYMTPLRLYLLFAVPFFFAFSLRHPRAGTRGDGLVEVFIQGAYFGAVEDAEVYNLPLEPLPLELVNDSVARAEWQAEFRRRTRENDAISAARSQKMSGGLQRVIGLLPFVVALVMAPMLAVLLGVGSGRQALFVARLVFSLHLHAVAYTALIVGWALGAGTLVPMAVFAVYMGFARHRVFRESVLASVLAAPLVLIAYGGVVVFTYGVMVLSVSFLLPSWVFSG